MTPTRPPRFATWLLKQFGCSDNNAAIMGDLAERYQQGKTAEWYWAQVAVTIAVGAFNDIRHHKLATIRDLMIGLWAQSVALGTGYYFQVAATSRWTMVELFPTINSWFPSWTYADFTISYWHLQTAIGSLIPLLAGIVSGWLVAKLHPSAHRSSHLAFCFTLVIVWIVYGLSGSIDLPYWMPALEILVSLELIGAFIGGLLMRKPRLPLEVA